MGHLIESTSQIFIPAGGDAPGTPASHFIRRREGLLKELKAPLLVLGVESEPGYDHLWWSNPRKAIQEPEFLYLTGINQPNCALILDPTETMGAKELLFLPDRLPKEEFWTGTAFGFDFFEEKEDPRATELTGISFQKPIEYLYSTLRDLQSSCGPIALFAHDYLIDHRFPPNFADGYSAEKYETASGEARIRKEEALDQQRKKLEAKGVVFAPCPELIWKQRLQLDRAQLHGVRRAQQIALDAFLETAAALPRYTTEHQLHRALDYALTRRTPWGTSFPSIVAAGKNSNTLHYIQNDGPLRKGELLLLDFGALWGTVPSDISRTIPISGKFNPLQRLLYEIVLETQQFHQKQVKPGATLRELNSLAWEFLEERLHQLLLSRGGTMVRPYRDAPHGISHLIGEQVHEGDPFRLSYYLPLEPGMMISNEPGLYGEFEMEIDGVLYSGPVGIRIEDNLLLTENGVENLSASFPHTADEIEQLLQSNS